MTIDINEIEERTAHRIASRMPEDSPLLDGDRVLCPYCHEPVRPRKSALSVLSPGGELEGEEDDPAAYLDTVVLKHASPTGCAYRAQFAVPMIDGCWPDLTAEEEYEKELGLRGGEWRIDFVMDGDRDETTSIEERMRAYGYIE